ncbi:MAG: hypothetical protein EON93_02500 [Burkholderiales bacterium]|nr:MAG: hypothetical protein EON93_02500 [Burkholderiales bacterium]
MKRPVSLVASLLLTLGVTAACSAAAAGKPQMAEACSSKMGSQTGCACFADTMEKTLSPEEFGQVAQAMYDNKKSSNMMPGNLASDAKISGAISEATMACFSA